MRNVFSQKLTIITFVKHVLLLNGSLDTIESCYNKVCCMIFSLPLVIKLLCCPFEILYVGLK